MRRAIAIFVLVIFPSLAYGDGGTLRLSQRVGDYQVSVFTSPAVLRVGLVDVSVLVQEADGGKVVMDVPVSVELRSQSDTDVALRGTASQDLATNKLFQAAEFQVPTPGTWVGRVFVGRSLGDRSAEFEMTVGPELPPWMAVAPWIGWPFVVVGLFLAHQWMKSRREPRYAQPASLRPAAATVGCRR